LPGSNTFFGSATMTGAPKSAYFVSDYWDLDQCTISVSVYPSAVRPLGPGTYTVTAEEGNGGVSAKTPPATLTIRPAGLEVRTSAVPDPSNQRNTILAAEFTGDWVEMFQSEIGTASYDSSPFTPAGSWSLRVTDAGGTVVHEESVERTQKSDTFGVSSFWADSPAGDYTLSATFTPAGAGSSNFAITNAEPLPFTVAGPAPGDAPTASPAPTVAPSVVESGSSVPLWVPATAGLLTLGLLAFLIVQIVRTVRRRVPSTREQVPA
jgi:hypothetical protein